MPATSICRTCCDASPSMSSTSAAGARSCPAPLRPRPLRVQSRPITGVTHSLNGREVIDHAVRISHAAMAPYDAIFCTSRDGREAMRKLSPAAPPSRAAASPADSATCRSASMTSWSIARAIASARGRASGSHQMRSCCWCSGG